MLPTDERPTIRQLPLPAKLVVSVFLISVGLGYFTALVQLHFQRAKPGSAFPTPEDAAEIYNGRKPAGDPEEDPVSKIEALVTADENKPFNGQGQMVEAFLEEGIDWEDSLAEHGGDENALREKRFAERDAFVAWINSGADREQDYEDDSFRLPEDLAGRQVTPWLLNDDGSLMVQTLIRERCTKCHAEGQNGPDFITYADVVPYMTVPVSATSGQSVSPRRMSVEKLAQTTHAHWLSFAMLYGLTGLIFACTSYPFWLRISLAPLVLVVQMIDISCWWLARLDGVGVYFAYAIPVTGGIVAVGLASQILLSLFNMYGTKGRAVLVGLMILAGLGGVVLKSEVIDPQLEKERESSGEGAEAD